MMVRCRQWLVWRVHSVVAPVGLAAAGLMAMRRLMRWRQLLPRLTKLERSKPGWPGNPGRQLLAEGGEGRKVDRGGRARPAQDPAPVAHTRYNPPPQLAPQ